MWVVDSPSPTLWPSDDMNAEYLHLMGAGVPLKQPNQLKTHWSLIQLFLFVYVEINGNDEDDIIIGATEASYSQPNIHLCKKSPLCDKNGCMERSFYVALETWLWAQPEPSSCHPMKSKSISKQTTLWFHYIYLWHETILFTRVGFFSFLITAVVSFHLENFILSRTDIVNFYSLSLHLGVFFKYLGICCDLLASVTVHDTWLTWSIVHVKHAGVTHPESPLSWKLICLFRRKHIS